MNRPCEFWRRIAFVFHRRRFDRDLEEEMRCHLEMRAEEEREAGAAPDEAQYAARRAFGNTTLLHETTREAWGWRFLDELAQDLRYASRMLRKSPGFTAVAALSLALGIGANTALFSLMDSILLQWLPVKDPQQLVYFVRTSPPTGWYSNLDSEAFEAIGRHRQSFSGVVAYTEDDRNFRAGGPPERARVQMVSSNYFPVLGVKALIGRTLVAEDGRPSASPAAVLSYRFWKRRFGLDPAVLARTVYVDQTAVTVAGVAPPEFFGIDAYGDVYPDLWLPIASGERPSMVWIVGRLKPGVPPARVRAELGPATAEIQEIYKDSMKGWSPRQRNEFLSQKLDFRPLSKGLESLRMRFSEPLQILAALSGLLLLIACANIANLLLARSAARSREISLRLSVGAGRGRLLRQLLTESVLLASLGGALGLGFAFWAHRLLLAFLLPDPASAVPLDLAFNYRLLGFAAAVSFVTGVLFGIAPALRSTRVDLYPSLQGESAAGLRLGLTRPLLALQVAASLLLVVTAGLFVRSLRNLQARDPGFDREHLLLMTLEPDKGKYKGDAVPGLYRELMDRIPAIPGVRSAALAGNTVFGSGWSKTVWVDGYNYHPNENQNVAFNSVGPGFFSTSGIPVLLGREFGPSDRDGAPLVAMVNEAFAKKYFPNESPLVHRFGDRGPASGRRYEVVGVVRDSRSGSLRQSEEPAVYQPLLQSRGWRPQSLELHVRTAGGPAVMAERIRREILAVDKDLPVYNIRTITQEISASLRRDRMFATLSTFFGLTALLLASVGLYGMLAYAVARRTKEISIRMALGAPRRRILWMVLRQTLLVVVAGSAIGLPAALSATGALKSVLFGLSPTDPATFAAAVAMLVAVAAIAGYIPARRATKVDPMEALRYE